MVAKNGIAVVIPAYKVAKHVLHVLDGIDSKINLIIVVDDACPQKSGELVASNVTDPRVKVLFHESNQGVGAAMITGYEYAKSLGAKILIKVDGDGQMDPSLIPQVIEPIVRGEADYVKGNRFNNLNTIRNMPKIRIVGNLVLSFMSKISSGYWNIFDPTNGYTAIHVEALNKLNLKEISKRYFFESDMLYQLGLVKAVVVDIPMSAIYNDEISNLNSFKSIFEFSWKHLKNALKRIYISYYIQEFTLASIELPIGLLLTSTSLVGAAYNAIHSSNLEQATPTGTLILICMAFLSGTQLLLAFTSYDIQKVPQIPLSKFR